MATSLPNLTTFAGGRTGTWRIDTIAAVRGAPLPPVDRLAVTDGEEPGESEWRLRGVTSNLRYTTQAEQRLLASAQPALGRTEATRAALIPVKKSAAWWEFAQDQRRAIFEERSRHIAIGLDYLPAVARRLHHCRELGEPFDFLTWFEYAPADAPAFERLVDRLRATEEWRFVEREVDIRLTRDGANGTDVHTEAAR